MADLPFPSVIGLKDGCHAPCKAIPLLPLYGLRKSQSKDKDLTEGKRNQNQCLTTKFLHYEQTTKRRMDGCLLG